MELAERPRPSIAANEILVKVHATPVTAGDRRLRAADFPGFTALFGRLLIGLSGPRHVVQGTMFAGQVEAVGADVTRFAVGDDVFGSVDHGAYAEYLSLPAAGPVAKMPAGLKYAAAAEVPYGGVTALRFLRDMAQVQTGEHVLIVGASGGVGRYAVQIARHLGAEVTAVCSTAQLEAMRALGAHHVIDYTREDFTQSGGRYDVIFDIADAARYGRCRHLLRPSGRFLTLFASLGILARALTTRLFGGPRASMGVALPRQADLETLADWLAQGVLRPVVQACFPLDEIVAAHAHAERVRSGGTIVCVAERHLHRRARYSSGPVLPVASVKQT
jgi:NADPH:quinone reductase-like Zn-dependent oxidoreductase